MAKPISLIVWIKFSHRLEERPFAGIGATKEDAIEDAYRFARWYWGLGEGVDMGLSTTKTKGLKL